jgi:uncharacterized protein YdeI (YjbR/CyaY-like superfamily)
MNKTDPRIDAYIEKAPDFAKPILTHLRQLVHRAHPGITETTKWGMPHFEYKGMVCSMAAFKAHCTFGFWKGTIMNDELGIFQKVGNTAMGYMGRITSLSDLPADSYIMAMVQQAVDLNERGIAVPKEKTKTVRTFEMPDMLKAALDNAPGASAYFCSMPPSHQNEYIQYIVEAKKEETRLKRLEKTMAMLAERKSLNEKYK